MLKVLFGATFFFLAIPAVAQTTTSSGGTCYDEGVPGACDGFPNGHSGTPVPAPPAAILFAAAVAALVARSRSGYGKG